MLGSSTAGMVFPLTADGIHSALRHGLATRNAVAHFLQGKCEDPCGWFVCTYPRHRAKRQLPFLFDHFQGDVPFNLLLGTRPMRTAAGSVYFHHNGVVDLVRAARPRLRVSESRTQARSCSDDRDAGTACRHASSSEGVLSG